MQREHKIIIALIVIILIIIVVMGTFAMSNLSVQKNNPNKLDNLSNHSSVATTKGPDTDTSNQATPGESQNTDNHNDEDKNNNNNDDKKYSEEDLQRARDEGYSQGYNENNHYEESSSSDSGNYLSADDYYVSDMGFVISRNHN